MPDARPTTAEPLRDAVDTNVDVFRAAVGRERRGPSAGVWVGMLLAFVSAAALLTAGYLFVRAGMRLGTPALISTTAAVKSVAVPPPPPTAPTAKPTVR